uniref:AAA ATPase domain-containing protein n=1 Tax=Candidatus Kentrum sp. FW TaxID=2126338 RepID=A0A450RTF2_9GAMM|nr:MAG: AAA ATPase domain-containing protein [Candidatus Kentron sp. FW]
MKIRVENLGALQQAEFTLGDLTILCGENNTGKTYATYALYGFLSNWRQCISIDILGETVQRLLSEGVVGIDVTAYLEKLPSLLEHGCDAYTKRLPSVFAASEGTFGESVFFITIDTDDVDISEDYEGMVAAGEGIKLFTFAKAQGSTKLIITLLMEKGTPGFLQETVTGIIGDVLKDILFDPFFPNPFIASSERTATAVFRNDLDLHRGGTDSYGVPRNLFASYSLPVSKNLEFVRQLERVSKRTGFLSQNHPDLLTDFSDIIGGEYTVTRNDELYFLPKGRRGIKLSMDASSSAVRSLLDIGFYLKHIAKPGDILMVDEPELNLHPRNQRRVARLFARLVNIGIKVFVTTHSDYLIKELNTLIMLHPGGPRLRGIAEREGYLPQELLSPEQVKVYITEEKLLPQPGKTKRKRGLTLTPANIDPDLGIEVRSFDTTIVEMNQIQDEILWGEE